MSDCFGGPTEQEKGLAAASAGLAASMATNYGTTFAEDQDVLGQLKSEVTQIQTGQTGPGFGPQEEAARVSQIQNAGAAQARNVAQAVREQTAGQGGGAGNSSGIASGVRQELTEQAASNAETNTSNALLANTAANYAQGRANAAQTVGGLTALSGQYNPNAAGSLAVGSSGQAFNQASTIEQQQAQADAALMGTITGGVGAAADILTGGLSALSGNANMSKTVSNNMNQLPVGLGVNPSAGVMLGPG